MKIIEKYQDAVYGKSAMMSQLSKYSFVSLADESSQGHPTEFTLLQNY